MNRKPIKPASKKEEDVERLKARKQGNASFDNGRDSHNRQENNQKRQKRARPVELISRT